MANTPVTYGISSNPRQGIRDALQGKGPYSVDTTLAIYMDQGNPYVTQEVFRFLHQAPLKTDFQDELYYSLRAQLDTQRKQDFVTERQLLAQDSFRTQHRVQTGFANNALKYNNLQLFDYGNEVGLRAQQGGPFALGLGFVGALGNTVGSWFGGGSRDAPVDPYAQYARGGYGYDDGSSRQSAYDTRGGHGYDRGGGRRGRETGGYNSGFGGGYGDSHVSVAPAVSPFASLSRGQDGHLFAGLMAPGTIAVTVQTVRAEPPQGIAAARQEMARLQDQGVVAGPQLPRGTEVAALTGRDNQRDAEIGGPA